MSVKPRSFGEYWKINGRNQSTNIFYHIMIIEPFFCMNINTMDDFQDFIHLERLVFNEIEKTYSRFHYIGEIYLA
jgi:hypothetical protein